MVFFGNVLAEIWQYASNDLRTGKFSFEYAAENLEFTSEMWAEVSEENISWFGYYERKDRTKKGHTRIRGAGDYKCIHSFESIDSSPQ